MKRIDTSAWGEFRVVDFFERMEHGKCGNVGALTDGDLPYIATSTVNNGHARSVEDSDGSLTSEGNCIALICDGNGSIGRNTYQAEPFVGSVKLMLGYHSRLNRWNGLFLVACLDKSVEVFGYSFAWKRSADTLKAETVRLPVTTAGEPDWEFMESVMRATMEEREKALEILFALPDVPRHVVDMNGWSEFKVVDLFTEIVRGRGTGAGSFLDGDVPYIAASYANNGYVRDVKDDDGSLTSEGNCIALICNGNGGIGRNTYQAEPFVGSGDLQLAYHPRLNQWNGLFLVACLDKSIERFNYSFAWKRNGAVFEDETVLLPATAAGVPDWGYMEAAMLEVMMERERALDALLSLKAS
ncbi:hypothetical protein DCE93_06565 [Agromyces badenianii]|uniref:Type I restriction modification DNA specificity domain-containing protein n=1 Tax=Agromyces badenianii TaxID=2080742 RepID=A0A2S0WVP0_9MICO|nr:restriction endonuclease subunit S [Agromyces badenianii]AWB95360.1 hypothetical protein DCE93_06565 [Agromyces badenianii]